MYILLTGNQVFWFSLELIYIRVFFKEPILYSHNFELFEFLKFDN